MTGAVSPGGGAVGGGAVGGEAVVDEAAGGEPVSGEAAGYAAAGFGWSLGWGRRPALVVVDLARAYFTPGSDLDLGSRTCLDSAARVLAAARAGGHPVVHTRVAYAEGGIDGGLFFRKVRGLRHFVAGDPLGEAMPEVAPLPGEVVVTKQYASGFFGTVLATVLTAQGVDTVVVVGVSTSGCVRATTLDALQHGFRPVVVREAVGDRDPRPHEANLFDLQAKYADVLSEDEVVRLLLGTPATAAPTAGPPGAPTAGPTPAAPTAGPPAAPIPGDGGGS